MLDYNNCQCSSFIERGVGRELKSTMDKRKTCLGSPSWMAPEVVMSDRVESSEPSDYDNRADVWALGMQFILIINI